ncbi:hypothetical protein HYS48_02000 [Candidatus Woesearchaeota archaeon]|nr:hypothetical protein [Candidatus Woesearchaeota archaeon]
MLVAIIAVLGFLLGLEHTLDDKKVSKVPLVGNRKGETMLSSWNIPYLFYILSAGVLLLVFQHFLPYPFQPSIEAFLVLAIASLALFLAKKGIQQTDLKYQSEKYGIVLHVFHAMIATLTFFLILIAAMQAFGQGMLYLSIFAGGAFLAVLFLRILMGMPIQFMRGMFQLACFLGVSITLLGVLMALVL